MRAIVVACLIAQACAITEYNAVIYPRGEMSDPNSCVRSCQPIAETPAHLRCVDRCPGVTVKYDASSVVCDAIKTSETDCAYENQTRHTVWPVLLVVAFVGAVGVLASAAPK